MKRLLLLLLLASCYPEPLPPPADTRPYCYDRYDLWGPAGPCADASSEGR